MRRGCKRRKRRRASATRGRRHAESTALAKLASRGRQPVSLPIRPAPRSDHRLRGSWKIGRTASAKRKSHARRSRYHERRSSRHREDLRSRQAGVLLARHVSRRARIRSLV
ncbi:unnamed protein product [Trichogramma brassicae]|uniref:Uncharacterized protein n=1 Tax=Trichogramma brassicae TaxID=86971 RepID=A0A6H5J061_9HYME|nr:unnamed protein product [Trichogramma brassicae]